MNDVIETLISKALEAKDLSEKISQIEEYNIHLVHENAQLRKENEILKKENETLTKEKETVNELAKELDQALQRIHEYRKDLAWLVSAVTERKKCRCGGYIWEHSKEAILKGLSSHNKTVKKGKNGEADYKHS